MHSIQNFIDEADIGAQQAIIDNMRQSMLEPEGVDMLTAQVDQLAARILNERASIPKQNVYQPRDSITEENDRLSDVVDEME